MVLSGRGPLLAIECKTGRGPVSGPAVRAFRSRFPKVPLVVASMQDEIPRRLESGLEILPWSKAIERYQAL